MVLALFLEPTQQLLVMRYKLLPYLITNRLPNIVRHLFNAEAWTDSPTGAERWMTRLQRQEVYNALSNVNCGHTEGIDGRLQLSGDEIAPPISEQPRAMR